MLQVAHFQASPGLNYPTQVCTQSPYVTNLPFRHYDIPSYAAGCVHSARSRSSTVGGLVPRLAEKYARIWLNETSRK